MMRVGILGGGQLARMLCLAAYPLDIQTKVYDEGPASPCQGLTETRQGLWTDSQAVRDFMADCDVVTYEFENVPTSTLSLVSEKSYPSVTALGVAQDRLSEKKLFACLGIPTAPYLPANSEAELELACRQLNLPVIAKTRREGYDGKGQYRLDQPCQARNAWQELGGKPLIVEEMITFDSECSVIVARRESGETVFYPVTENIHQQGILVRSLAPAPHISEPLAAKAQAIAAKVVERLNYVGILTIELFKVGEEFFANEMAPRVHNSGHWTIDGAITSQFENHLRAILDLPLGCPNPRGYAGMLNLIGDHPPLTTLAQSADAKIHLYHKLARPGRKLGHINFEKPTMQELSVAMKSWVLASGYDPADFGLH